MLLRRPKKSDDNVNSRWPSDNQQTLKYWFKYRRADYNLVGQTALPARPMTTITTSDSKHRLHGQPITEVGILRTTHVEIREEPVGQGLSADTNSQAYPWTTNS